MKHIKQILVFLFIISVLNSCEKEEEISYALDDISAPTNIAAHFDISTEEVGLVTITPAADGASMFEIYFGNEENETPTEVAPGETITHVYGEGEFNLRIVAVGLTGLTSELVRVVTISLEAPEDLEVDVTISGTNPFEIEVIPSALNTTVFDLYYGDVEDEEPTTILAGETATHVYAEIGEYTVRVVARGAGAATLEYSEDISITGASNSMSLPLNFDDALVNYTFVGFNGASFEVVDNPDLSGVNSSASKVGAISNSGAEYEGGTFELEPAVDFSGDNKTITMKFWSEVSLPVLLKFEGGVNDERQNEVAATHGGTGWEELTFNYATDAVKSYIDGNQGVGEPFVPTGQYASMVLFIDGPGTTAGTFYIDDVKQSEGNGGSQNGFATSLPMDFETNKTFSGVFEAAQGVAGVIVENPAKAGENTSETVFQFTKANGAAWYSGIFQVLPQNLDLDNEKSFTFKIWSPKAGINVRMNLEKEGDGGGPALSIDQTLTEANKWVTLVYNFSDLINDGDAYDKLVIFPEYEEAGQIAGDGSVYYIDDLEQTSGGAAPTGGKTSFPINFETSSTGGTSQWNVFEGETPPLVVIDNPDPSGINTSSKVAKFNAPFPGANYAGTNTVLETSFTLDASNSTVKIMVWKSVISDVGIKFEADFASTGEIKVPNTKINQWEEITFDFSDKIGESSSININGIVVFPDFDDRSQNNVVYFDNITLSEGSTGGGGTSGPAAAAPTPKALASNVRSIFSDSYSDPSGVNYFRGWGQSTAFEMLSINGNNTIKYSEINFQGIEIGENVDASAYESVHIDVWSGDYTSLPFSLISAGSGERSVTLNLTPNKWNTIVIPLSEFSGQGLTLNDIFQFKFDVQPNNGGTIYFDNLYFSTSGSNDGGPTGVAPYAPIDFETGGYGANWTWNVFENGSDPALEIVANPSISGINTSSQVAKFTASQTGQAYAGVESKRNEDIGDFTFDASNSIVKIMVYKTEISDVGLKFSESNGEAQPEVKVANTKVNQWEELTFDLSGSIGAGATGVITQIIIFPDFQSRSSDNVVYFDNITFGSN